MQQGWFVFSVTVFIVILIVLWLRNSNREKNDKID